MPDWIAGASLIASAVVSSRDWSHGRQYQIAAWAFMSSLLFSSFLGNLEEWITPAPAAMGATGLVVISQGPYTAIIGILLVLAVGALISSLRATHGPAKMQT